MATVKFAVLLVERTPCCSTPKKSTAIKRRQRRKQKARKRLMHKFDGSSSHSQAPTSPDPNLKLLTPPVTPIEILMCEEVNSLPQAIDEETGTSDTDSYPGDHCHDDLLEQAELARKAKRRKQDFLQQKYGDIVDDSPAFVNPTHEHHLPPTLTGIDRVIVKAHYEELEDRERNALQKA